MASITATRPHASGWGQIGSDLDNLYQNLLAGLASPALRTMIEERETEKARLEAHAVTATKRSAEILPHPVLLELFEQKVAALRVTLNDASVRTEAAQVLATLIESITIHPGGEHGAEAEVVAKVGDLMAYATNDNAAPKGGVAGSIAVVAGTGFDLCRTFIAPQSMIAADSFRSAVAWQNTGLPTIG